MTTEQWDFVDEVVFDLRAYADKIQHSESDDPFVRLMILWALPLLMLTWETFDSIVALVRRGNRRVAFAMIRPLTEYAVRMAFYAIDCNKMVERVQKRQSLGPAGTVYGTEAYKDWTNGGEKFKNYLSNVNLDLGGLSDAQRTELQKLLDDAQDGRAQAWATMLDKVEGKDTVYGKLFAAEYGMQSAYLHGDQLATVEMLGMPRPDEMRANFSSMFSEQRVISTALTAVFMLMIAVGKATGRPHGVYFLPNRFRELFDTNF